MSGYIGTKAVTLSTTAANVGGDSTIGGDLTVDTNTLYVDSTNNRIGVGTVSPSYLFHASGSGDAVAAVTAGATSIAALNLGNSTNLADGGIRYDNSADALIFRSANAERLRILSSGGITFNGDTATANALSDYEEGSYTANVIDASGNTSSTSYTGYYTKIGNFVHVSVYLPNIDTTGLVSTDSVYITLPFAGVSSHYETGSCITDNVTFSSGRTQVNPRTSTTADYVIFRGSGSAVGDDNVAVSEISSGVTDIFFSVGYRTS